MTDRELMQQALDALEEAADHIGCPDDDDAIGVTRKALRARLAQPEPEPVACPYCHYSHTLGAVYFDQNCAGCVKRMTAPPQREWQGLTDEEAFDAFGFHLWPESFLANVSQELKDTHEEAKKEVLGKVRVIEAKLKEKNT